MSLRTTITISQKPMLVMTPKLQQAIRILAMPRLELTQYISQQMVENPILEEIYDEAEEVAGESEGSDDESTEADVDLEAGTSDDNDAVDEGDSPELDVTDDEFGDINWQEYFDDHPVAKSEWEAPLDDDMRDDVAALEETLEEHLLWQLRMSVVSKDDYAIGEAIIGNIDEDGYLTTDVKEIAEILGCEVAEVERVLLLIQSFEPMGVGSRDLSECLGLQLIQLGLENTIAYEIVKDKYLMQDLEANRYPQIAKSLKVELDLVCEAANAISSLEPKPGRQFNFIKPEYVVPDVTVEKIDGKYRVFMNDYGPRLRLSPYYHSMLSLGDSLSSETREYIQSKIQSAAWLLEIIERRRKTILSVTESIFEVQKDFLEKGPGYLKPLTLKDIANMVDVGESTVSRVTRNRYVQTPRGVFELKYFFNSSLSTEDGGITSSASVKELIKNMIDNEDTQNPLSDKDIELMLNEKGIEIARRTINKYRGELSIPPSSKRRKW